MLQQPIERVEVQYDNSIDAMYGSATDDPTSGINVDASESKFEEMLKDELVKEFPDAEIIVETGYGRYSADGDTSSLEAMTVGEIVNRVWNGFGWIVEK